MTKQEFLKTEVGIAMRSCVQLLDEALKKRSEFQFGTVGYEQYSGIAGYCKAQWDVYEIILKELFGQEYYFFHTEECFGVCTEDKSEWLLKVERCG